MLLAGCTPDTQSENETVTERMAVSPSGVVLASPTELEVGLQSCGGDPVVDELDEDDEQVRIRIVTTMVVSGPSDDCADGLTITLQDPLDGRTVIDLVSEQPIDVIHPDAAADPDSLASQTERGPVSLAGWGVKQVSPRELVVDVPSCNGDPGVDELVEDDDQVRIRIVTTVVTSGDAEGCLDRVELSLLEPLGDRNVVDAESGETLSVTPAFDPDVDSLAGLCEEMIVEVAEGEPGLDTEDEAIDTFVASGGEFLSDATFEGQQIIYEGEVVGRMSVSSRPAGGYVVTSAEWCYPEDY